MTVVTEAAARLARAAESGQPCAPIRELIGPTDIDAAYDVQTINVNAALAAGKRLSGRKIGLTSPAVQAQLGVDRPDFGVLFTDMDCSGLSRIGRGRLMQPRIEAEVAFILSADINDTITAVEAPEYVGRVHAALEIVDSRIAGWDISLSDTVADNASASLYVLGESQPVQQCPDLASVQMTMTEDDVSISRGVGADCLGSPWEALVWLANTAVSLGSPLHAGDVILSGALGPMVSVQPGATYRATVSGVGCVAAAFAD